MYIYIYVCMYVCMYVYIYIYIYIHKSGITVNACMSLKTLKNRV